MGKSSEKKEKDLAGTVVNRRAGSLHEAFDKRLFQNTDGRKVRNFKYYLAASVSLITFLVYLKSLQYGFVSWDDSAYVFENLHIRSFDSTLLKWAFFDFYASNWHPLTWLSHALDYAAWGLNPLGHHLTNNILHAANTFIVVLLVSRLLEIYKEGKITEGTTTFLNDKNILIAGGVAGSLFGLHPIHVESVAWVAERKDLLCALFFLLSVLMYGNYAKDPHADTLPPVSVSRFLNRYYLLSFGFFLLALLSKPMAVTVPAVLLILDWFPLEKIRSATSAFFAFIEKLPFLALSLASSLLTMLAQKTGGAMGVMNLLPVPVRIAVAARSVIVYLVKMVLPLNLVPFYPYPRDVSLISMEYFSVIVLLVLITAACVAGAKKKPLYLSVWAYYVLTLLPVLGLVQVGLQSMADRYTYLPSAGPFLLTGVLAAWCVQKAISLKKASRVVTAAAVLLAVVAAVTLSYSTFQQIGVWKNDITLWSRVIEKEPGEVPLAYKNRGGAYSRMGRPDKAIEDYDMVISLGIQDGELFVDRGLDYLQLGRRDLAIIDFRTACQLGNSFGCNAPQFLLPNGLKR